MCPRVQRISPSDCSTWAASLTPSRRTPSMSASPSCVVTRSLACCRSRVSSRRRHNCCRIEWWRLQAAVWPVCAISAWASRRKRCWTVSPSRNPSRIAWALMRTPRERNPAGRRIRSCGLKQALREVRQRRSRDAALACSTARRAAETGEGHVEDQQRTHGQYAVAVRPVPGPDRAPEQRRLRRHLGRLGRQHRPHGGRRQLVGHQGPGLRQQRHEGRCRDRRQQRHAELAAGSAHRGADERQLRRHLDRRLGLLQLCRPPGQRRCRRGHGRQPQQGREGAGLQRRRPAHRQRDPRQHRDQVQPDRPEDHRTGRWRLRDRLRRLVAGLRVGRPRQPHKQRRWAGHQAAALRQQRPQARHRAGRDGQLLLHPAAGFAEPRRLRLRGRRRALRGRGHPGPGLQRRRRAAGCALPGQHLWHRRHLLDPERGQGGRPRGRRLRGHLDRPPRRRQQPRRQDPRVRSRRHAADRGSAGQHQHHRQPGQAAADRAEGWRLRHRLGRHRRRLGRARAGLRCDRPQGGRRTARGHRHPRRAGHPVAHRARRRWLRTQLDLGLDRRAPAGLRRARPPGRRRHAGQHHDRRQSAWRAGAGTGRRRGGGGLERRPLRSPATAAAAR
jgi:hypothetical protein